MKSARTIADGADPNLNVYNAPQVVAYYGALEYLSPAEQLLFERHLHPGDCILDLGVGGGRTTPYLSSISSRYVGADYAKEMVALCRQRFPDLLFVVADATRLSIFADASFDAVVMAFNGFDYVLGEIHRKSALAEIRRVLRIGGVFIFSSHNPRAILHRTFWNRRRLDELAARIAPGRGAMFSVLLLVLTLLRAILAWARAFVLSAGRTLHRIFRRAFWCGEGYMMDPAHGGLLTYYAVPPKVEAELTAAGFHLLQVLGDDYPKASSLLMTDWYYYVFSTCEAPRGPSR